MCCVLCGVCYYVLCVVKCCVLLGHVLNAFVCSPATPSREDLDLSPFFVNGVNMEDFWIGYTC